MSKSPINPYPFVPVLTGFANGAWDPDSTRAMVRLAVIELQNHLTRSDIEIELDGLAQYRRSGLIHIFDGEETHHSHVRLTGDTSVTLDGEPLNLFGRAGKQALANALIELVERSCGDSTVEVGP